MPHRCWSVDTIARLGGNEFVILVGASAERPTNLGRTRVIADPTLQEMSRRIIINVTNVSIATSIGAVITAMPTTLENLLTNLDAALSEAKHNNRNQHHMMALR
ncbi:MAG: diguanylate cyclase (GGDEF)-like protein [Acidimicrobiales bacterium]